MTDCPLDIDACLLNWKPGASILAHLLPNSRPICFILHLEGSEHSKSGNYLPSRDKRTVAFMHIFSLPSQMDIAVGRRLGERRLSYVFLS